MTPSLFHSGLEPLDPTLPSGQTSDEGGGWGGSDPPGGWGGSDHPLHSRGFAPRRSRQREMCFSWWRCAPLFTRETFRDRVSFYAPRLYAGTHTVEYAAPLF